MRTTPLISLAIAVAALFPGAAHAEVWTALARAEGTPVLCGTASSKAMLDGLLDKAGWSMYGRKRPDIDFTREFAAVVAPGKFQQNSDLKLSSATVEGGKRVVRWRYVVRVEQHDTREGVSDYSSLGEPGNEILVVTYPIEAVRLTQSCIGPY